MLSEEKFIKTILYNHSIEVETFKQVFKVAPNIEATL